MRIRSSYLIAAAIAAVLTGWLMSGQIGAGGAGGGPEAESQNAYAEPRLVSVRVRESVAAQVERVLVINGKSEAARTVRLRAETNGRVVALGPARGAAVEEGEVLVRLDPRERRAMLSQAEATLGQREIEHQAATTLGEKGFQAQTRVAEARAALEAAQAQLERIRIDLEHTEIRAPFDGILEERPVEIGDFIDIGDAVATVIDQNPFLVVGHVAEHDVGRLQVGMPGQGRLVTGQMVEGRLRYVGSQADPGTRTFRIELEVPNSEGRLAAGVTAELRIAYEQAQAHRLPASLLALSDQGEVGIKAVNGDDEVVFHRAEIVRSDGGAVWIAGLPERLRVITVGQGFVRPGDQVRAMPDGDAAEQGPLVAERRS